MSITRANAEVELVSRASKKMVLVGFAVTVVGTNADLNGPLATALRKMGLTASSTVSDGDLAALEAEQIDEFYDRAELRLLENIVGNIDLTDIQVGQRRESLGQLADQVEKALTRLTARVEKEYGVGLSELGVGSLMMNFQQDEPDE
jgi:hypothetical protein